ncbi:50S ribosomal protein L15e [Candidatus Woesearchaeota archaeon]|nr:50S ribosomal protein L15e [Candidatus Woesearchaeota archaeon]
MGLYKYLSKIWQDNRAETKGILKERLIKWRKEPAITAVGKPTRLDKARRVGYKAKQGITIARVRIATGGRQRRSLSKGRKPKRYGMRKFSPVRSLQAIAEQRASKKFPNMEVLNSYYVAEDSKSKWFEVIIVDKHHPAIMNDKDISWITNVRGRAERGLTSAGKKSRGSRRNVAKAKPKRSKKEKSRIKKRRG